MSYPCDSLATLSLLFLLLSPLATCPFLFKCMRLQKQDDAVCLRFHSQVCVQCHILLQIEKEFPQILSIHDSLKKFVFEPNAKNKPQVLAAVKEMRGR